MADRHLAPNPDRAGEPSAADAPIVDLIFPNREQPRSRGYVAATGHRAPDPARPDPREATGSMPRVRDQTGAIPRIRESSGPPPAGHNAPAWDNTGSMPRARHDGTGSIPRARHDGTGSIPRVRPDGTGSMPRVRDDGTGSIPRVRPDGTGFIPRVRDDGTGGIPRVRRDHTGHLPPVPRDSTGTIPAYGSTQYDPAPPDPTPYGQAPYGPASYESAPFESPRFESPRFEPTPLASDAGVGEPTGRRASGLRRLISRGKPSKVRIAPGIGEKPVRRRRLLLGMGTGVVVAGGAAAAATLLTGAVGSASSDHFPNTNLGLGAAGLGESPTDAAQVASLAKPTWPTPLGRDPELHLLRRATFGPTLVDVVAVKQMGLDAWLERQFSPQSIADPLADQILATYPTVSMSTAQIRQAVKENDGMAMTQLGHATLARQIWSSRQLFEVMVDFWANHLNVTNPSDGLWDTRTPYDNDVIRAHALGRFGDMLWASARAPAMMKYLDNANSQKKSVNENYGRELLELHTVGLDAKYTEVDVRNSAYIMTGRTVNKDNAFSYDKSRHWVGPVKVMGFSHPNDKTTDGLALGDWYLGYLATHPNTAKRIAFKLARRFVCDDPPQTLVDRLAQSYLDNGTAIVPVLRTLFSSVEFWMSTGLKTRRPLENVVATARIVGVAPGAKTADGVAGLYRTTEQLGHAPLTWGPPDGFPDYADAWGSAHATLGNWNAHRAIVQGAQKGLTYPKPETLVGLKPENVGIYIDTISRRLVQQDMLPAHKQALIKFLGLSENGAVKDLRLGGKIDSLVPLVLDSVYHALR